VAVVTAAGSLAGIIIMTPTATACAYLSDQLERLMALPLVTPADVERWYQESSRVEQTLAARFPDFDFEHDVLHFFNDADIRSRDSGYLDRQHRLMINYVERLRHGHRT
jgi:hypothetical protein